MPSVLLRRLIGYLLLSLISAGCQKSAPAGRKPTVPVRGKVIVDGQPAEMVSVACNPVEGIDTKNPTITSTVTGKDGVFQLMTYETGDGVPEGKYRLTFEWTAISPLKRSAPEDKLGGRYRDPARSEFPLDVKPGEPIDLGEIKLTTTD